MFAKMVSANPGLEGEAKLEEVTNLMNKLKIDLKEKNLLPPQRNAMLEQLKVYGRQVENADPIFTDSGVETLTRHSFDGNSLTTSREALRCLANTLFLDAKTRQIFVDLGYAGKAAERLKVGHQGLSIHGIAKKRYNNIRSQNDNRDDEFLISRILFLTTYDTNVDFEMLIDEHSLADSINSHVARHSKQYSRGGRKSPRVNHDELALSETLKLIFNITHFYPGRAAAFTKSIPHIFKILSRHKIPTPPLQAPVCYLINALINLDLEDKNSQQFGVNPIFPKFDQKTNAERLIDILDISVIRYRDEELDQQAAPLMTVIRKIYEPAPESVKRYMRWLLLPSDDERNRPLGKSNTLSSRLLKLSSSPMAPTIRENISALMFELSDKDATSFVQNVGYGFASGFLMSHNVPIPSNALEAWSTNGSHEHEDGQSNDRPVNPITGQRLDMEPKDTGPEMTEEEKEKEAEKLFVLFERLKKTGVVDVKNPVEEAVQSGRFEELPSDDDDEIPERRRS
ncbi:MAG: hypothetical protein M1827_001948 [Pycnora praestabilis]|nr:MAG: hypothetical protein M1827_001948 [Pycnora praestabilis]